MGIQANVMELLPEDGSAHGFDKVSSALTLSPVQIEKYLEAADLALDAALGSGQRPKFVQQRYAATELIAGWEVKSQRRLDDGGLVTAYLESRGGVLTQAAVLKVTANGTTTSPVIRGAWLAHRILGKPVPQPPANVPAVEPDIRGTNLYVSMLQRLGIETDKVRVQHGNHARVMSPRTSN